MANPQDTLRELMEKRQKKNGILSLKMGPYQVLIKKQKILHMKVKAMDI